MRLALTGLVASLCVALAACAGSGGGTQPRDGATSSAASDANATGHRHKDIDNDEDNNDDDRPLFEFGHPANPADRRAITNLLAGYYAAAAGENGRGACALLAPLVAESVVEDYGHTKLQGSSCAAVTSKLFEREHALLSGKRATLQILRIGIEGNKSLIALNFPSIHEARQMSARRIKGRWTILRLLDGIME